MGCIIPAVAGAAILLLSGLPDALPVQGNLRWWLFCLPLPGKAVKKTDFTMPSTMAQEAFYLMYKMQNYKLL